MPRRAERATHLGVRAAAAERGGGLAARGAHTVEPLPVEDRRLVEVAAVHVADRDGERVNARRREERRDNRRVGHARVALGDGQPVLLARELAELGLDRRPAWVVERSIGGRGGERLLSWLRL